MLKDLVPVEYQGQRLLTGKQLAEFYGTTPNVIKHNFRNNREHFVEGTHYFKLKGEVLKELKRRVWKSTLEGNVITRQNPVAQATNLESALEDRISTRQSPVAQATNELILYTVQGAARHAKILTTQKAWDIFNELEQFYFANKTVEPPPVQDSLFPDVEPVKPKKRCLPKLAVVYVVEFDNATCKIGFTSDLTERIARLVELTKLGVTRYHSTSFMPLEDARQLEAALKTSYADSPPAGRILFRFLRRY